jgi:hypothetical protein
MELLPVGVVGKNTNPSDFDLMAQNEHIASFSLPRKAIPMAIKPRYAI